MVPFASCLSHNLAQTKQPKVYEVHWTWEVKRPPPLEEAHNVSRFFFYDADETVFGGDERHFFFLHRKLTLTWRNVNSSGSHGVSDPIPFRSWF